MYDTYCTEFCCSYRVYVDRHNYCTVTADDNCATTTTTTTPVKWSTTIQYNILARPLFRPQKVLRVEILQPHAWVIDSLLNTYILICYSSARIESSATHTHTHTHTHTPVPAHPEQELQIQFHWLGNNKQISKNAHSEMTSEWNGIEWSGPLFRKPTKMLLFANGL